MHKERVWAAILIVAIMVGLQWTHWMGSSIEPTAFGLPLQYWYFVAYAVASVIALWGVFKLVWPQSDRDW